MQKIHATPRPDWQQQAEEQGFVFHSVGGTYWKEDCHYLFHAQEIDRLEAAVNELSDCCLQAVEHVIVHKDYARFCIPEQIIPLIEQSWEREDPSLYGRFDLAYDGQQIKLLEYNADTPTSLFEASVFQWQWFAQQFKDKEEQYGQFNGIHEMLIEHLQSWKDVVPGLLHFSCDTHSLEDLLTTEYLRYCAGQAGFDTRLLDMAEIGLLDGRFVGLADEPIDVLFKLYPWEWMMAEPFGAHIPQAGTRFVEPPWKMILSNKMLLVVLWELFPDHPLLLPAYTTPDRLSSYARKPLLSREGANISLVDAGRQLESTDGVYGEEGYVYQERVQLPCFEGYYPVIGAWLVDHQAAGIGIREDASPITTDRSHFVPHTYLR